jgi:hypothetical protein
MKIYGSERVLFLIFERTDSFLVAERVNNAGCLRKEFKSQFSFNKFLREPTMRRTTECVFVDISGEIATRVD